MIFASTALCSQYIRKSSQHYRFNVDLLSYFADAKLKHCSQMKLKLSVHSFVPGPSKSEHPVVFSELM